MLASRKSAIFDAFCLRDYCFEGFIKQVFTLKFLVLSLSTAFNTELMQLLEERDDLHMAQDSMLVDIEDLTRLVARVV